VAPGLASHPLTVGREMRVDHAEGMLSRPREEAIDPNMDAGPSAAVPLPLAVPFFARGRYQPFRWSSFGRVSVCGGYFVWELLPWRCPDGRAILGRD
jgi:hypothetical protein